MIGTAALLLSHGLVSLVVSQVREVRDESIPATLRNGLSTHTGHNERMVWGGESEMILFCRGKSIMETRVKEAAPQTRSGRVQPNSQLRLLGTYGRRSEMRQMISNILIGSYLEDYARRCATIKEDLVK